MNFDLPTVSSIVLAILGIVGGVGFWQYRISRKDAPVRKQEADMAVAEKSQQMAMAIAERLDKDYTQVRADLVELTAQVVELRTRSEDQDRTITAQGHTISILRRAVQAFSDAWDDLILHWERYRLSETPPNRPSHSLDYE